MADRHSGQGRPSRSGGHSGNSGRRRDDRRRDGGGRRSGPQRPRADHQTPTVDRARIAAHRALSAVFHDDAYANLALPKILREEGLKGRDSAFTTELVYGTLRFQGRYDAMISHCLDGRSVESLQPALRIALRMGAHQLSHMRIPQRAAVYETVNLVKVVAGPAPVALANAVLRKIAQRDLEEWEDLIRSQEGDHAWFSHPTWITAALTQALSLEGNADELEELLEVDNIPARVTAVVRPGLADRDEFLAAVEGSTPTTYSPYGVKLPGGAPADIEEIRTGQAGIQDEGSQLMAILMADAPLEGTDTRWLDMCAGPGGKTALLGAIAKERGATVDANELHPHRADLVRHATALLTDTVAVTDGDSRTIGDTSPGLYDRILVDAPCTGLGALRRRPESRWRRSNEDLAVLTKLQRELLASALKAVRIGGIVVYVTCSPHPAETVAQVLDALRGDAEPVDAPEILRAYGVEFDRSDSYPTPQAVQLWPHRHGTDAMFGAVLRRTK